MGKVLENESGGIFAKVKVGGNWLIAALNLFAQRIILKSNYQRSHSLQKQVELET